MDLFLDLLTFRQVFASSNDGLETVMHIFLGILLWAMILTVSYFCLYPVIWDRQYKYHTVKAEVTFKNHYVTSHTTYTKVGDVQVPNTYYTHHHEVTFRFDDERPYFLSKNVKRDISESTFDDLSVGDKVELELEEKLGYLETVFKNGKVTKEYSLTEIRERASIGL